MLLSRPTRHLCKCQEPAEDTPDSVPDGSWHSLDCRQNCKCRFVRQSSEPTRTCPTVPSIVCCDEDEVNDDGPLIVEPCQETGEWHRRVHSPKFERNSKVDYCHQNQKRKHEIYKRSRGRRIQKVLLAKNVLACIE